MAGRQRIFDEVHPWADFSLLIEFALAARL